MPGRVWDTNTILTNQGFHTCEIDLDLLAKHLQGQVLHGRGHRAPGVVDQGVNSPAPNCSSHLPAEAATITPLAL